MTFVIERVGYFPESTLGRIIVPTTFPPIASVELPWKNNEVGRSCIPLGEWDVVPTMFYHGDGPGGKPDYPTYEIIVPGRRKCDFHIANYASELEGCVAPGIGYTVNASGELGVHSSAKAFALLKAWLDAQTRPLKVIVRNAPEQGRLQ